MATQPQVLSRYRPSQGSSFLPGDEAWNPALAQPTVDPETGGNPYGTPDNPNLNNPSTTNPVYGNVGAPPGGASGKFATTGAGTNLPVLNTDPNQPIHEGFYNNEAIEQAMNQQIYNEGQNQLGYYGPLQSRYQGAQDEALQSLKDTPGYTNSEQMDIRGDPNQARADVTAGVAGEQGAVDQYGEQLGGAVDKYGNLVNQGVDTLKSGLDKSQEGFSKLDSAVNNPALAFDPNGTERQLSDADVQEMKTAAGTRVGNQYRSAEDQLRRDAAAQGNSSPLAIAAANARLQHQSAADQGDAEVNADIASRQAQQQRAAQIEGQRESAVQTQTGMKAQAATTEQGQAQNAAGLAGTQTIAANEAVGKTGVDAANQFGQTNIAEKNNITGQKSAASTAFDTANSQRSQQIADTRLTGQGAYRSGVAQQQGLAQQGGQTAVQQQQNATTTLGNQLNTSTANRANYEVGGQGNSAVNQAAKVAGAVLKTGGIVTEPTLAVVGEAGKELIVPLPRYRHNERMAA